MKKRMTRISAFLMGAVLLIGMTGCSGNKKYKEMKKTAEGVVENYIVFLATGKMDKLSRYCDPDDDPFQDTIDAKTSKSGTKKGKDDIYPNPEYLPFWRAYLSHLKFTFGEFTLKGDDGKLEVNLSLIDAKKALRSSVEPSSEDILHYLTEADTYIEKPITLSLNCDTDSGTCKIKDTQVLFKECKKQFDIVLKELPMKNAKLDTLFVDFMDHLLDMDTVFMDSDGFYIGIEPSDYTYSDLPLYRAMTSLYSYEYEFVSGGDESAEFKMTFHKKEEDDALRRFFGDPRNWAPSYEKMLTYALEAPSGFNGLDDLWPIDAMAPGLTDYLQGEADKDLIIRGEIKLDPHVVQGYRVTGDFKDALPTMIRSDYLAPSSEPEFINDAYNFAMQSLLNKGEISNEEFGHLQQLTMCDLTTVKYSEIMEKHGFTKSKANRDLFDNYKKDDRIKFEIVTADSANSTLIYGLQDYTDIEAKIADGSYTGSLSGGWMSYEFRGQITKAGNTKEYYKRYVIFDDHCMTITVDDCTDEDVEEISTIIKELGLNW